MPSPELRLLISVAAAWLRPPALRRLRARRELARLVRCLALLLAFELSGCAPLLLGASDDSCCEEGACSDCPLEKEGDRCPPNCSGCHVPLRSLAPQPGARALLLELREREAGLEQCPHQASVPRAPPLARVYRPPRSNRVRA